MANTHNLENTKPTFPEFLSSNDELAEVENLNMSQRRKRLGTGALESFMQAENHEFNPLQEMEDTLKSKIIGQPQAIDAIIEALTRESLHNPNQPIANFMFLGPTGVGKSETAKVLAEMIDDSDDDYFDNLIRIDCSDYKNGHEVATLTGSPLGFVGSDQPPKLSYDAVEGGGKTVILFDEVEKGSEELYDLMLHIMDDGTLETMGETREKVSFSNSIIIMTSNLGAHEISKISSGITTGFAPNGSPKRSEDMEKEVVSAATEAMKQMFKPEFINRISQNVVYRSFDDAQLGEVIDAKIDRENQRYRDHGFDLTTSEALRDHIVDITKDRRENNARAVLRNYERMVEGGLARHYLAGSIPVGSEVYADLDENNEVSFMYSENPALKYQVEAAKVATSRLSSAQKLEMAEDEADEIADEVVHSTSSKTIEKWSNDNDTIFVNGKRIYDMSDLESMYDSGFISAQTLVEVGISADWFYIDTGDTPETDNFDQPDNIPNVDMDEEPTADTEEQ